MRVHHSGPGHRDQARQGRAAQDAEELQGDPGQGGEILIDIITRSQIQVSYPSPKFQIQSPLLMMASRNQMTEIQLGKREYSH